MRSLILLAIILLATFGAGTFDVLFPDVIPVRPYTGVFVSVHAPTLDNMVKTVLPPVPIFIVTLVLISIVTIMLFPHLSFLPLIPLGSRGSHSRANRRAGAGWTNKSTKDPVSPEEQFRVLMEVFGRPKMVIVYDKQKPDGKTRQLLHDK